MILQMQKAAQGERLTVVGVDGERLVEEAGGTLKIAFLESSLSLMKGLASFIGDFEIVHADAVRIAGSIGGRRGVEAQVNHRSAVNHGHALAGFGQTLIPEDLIISTRDIVEAILTGISSGGNGEHVTPGETVQLDAGVNDGTAGGVNQGSGNAAIGEKAHVGIARACREAVTLGHRAHRKKKQGS